MKTRVQALLVHGMGSFPGWWDPFLAPLEAIGVRGVALEMPSLADAGPEAWCAGVVRRIGPGPTVLVGHSLGAAVCLMASLEARVDGLILLACPPFVGGFSPQPPRTGRLSVTAVARIGRFLRRACECAARVTAPAIHLVGDADAHVPVAEARRLPFPLETVSDADHDLDRSPAAISAVMRHLVFSDCGRRRLDPGLRLRYGPRDGAFAAARDGLAEEAPPPARLDVEITTRCPLACPACARTLGYGPAADVTMSRELFAGILEAGHPARELILVGLGEPLLHPEVGVFVGMAARAGYTTRLVTNGVLAEPDRVERLRDAGLAEITFSIDTLDPTRFRQLRPGASLDGVLANFRGVPGGLRKSVFVTLTRDNAGDLADLVALAHAEKLPALALSDVNFAENRPRALHGGGCEPALQRAIEHARRLGVLLIGPHVHELPDAWRDGRRALVRTPEDLTARAGTHLHCLAPWRIAVIGADGTVTPCNCAPRAAAGRFPDEPLQAVWNGDPLRTWRRRMLDADCADCRACPRY